jgi:dTDP-4-dehydrorhamnose reductase
MSKVPLLTTGLNGLVGSKLADDFAEQYEFENLDQRHPTHPVDITNAAQVQQLFAASSAQTVVHFAAYTDVTGAWTQSGDKNGVAYQVNVVGTENIVAAAEATGKHLIHISTSYVFDGEKEGLYTEDDQPNPIEWYGQTKLLAEEVVQARSTAWTILRIDQPFRSDTFSKPDAVRKMIQLITAEKPNPLFANHFFGPTFIDDFAKVIDWVIRTQTTGLFHASSGESWSDYEFGQAINETFELGKELRKGDLDEYLKTAQRPYQRNTAMSCEKLKNSLDFELHPIRQALETVQI